MNKMAPIEKETEQRTQRENKYLSKIGTGVAGLDELFYDGFRLPNPKQPNVDMNGIVLVIYGERGTAKNSLAMQIMRGVHSSLVSKEIHTNAERPLYCTLRHRIEEVERVYRSQVVMEAIDAIKLPKATGSCKLCDLFDVPEEEKKQCERIKKLKNRENIEECRFVEMIRSEIGVFNPRLESLHINGPDSSNENNYYKGVKESSIIIEEVSKPRQYVEKAECSFLKIKTEQGYLPDALMVFNEAKNIIKAERKELENKAKEMESQKKDGPVFGRSSVLIEGFSILDESVLKRIPYNDLIDDLRKLSAVSILVFDEEYSNLEIKADIVINMRITEDKEFRYQYRDLHIEKSDLQPRIRGWHRYSTNHDTLVRVYPNMWTLLSNRFSKENAVSRMWQSEMYHSKSLCSFGMSQIQEGEIRIDNSIYENIVETYGFLRKKWHKKARQKHTYDERYSKIHVNNVNSMYHIINDDKTRVLYVLVGKTCQSVRKEISELRINDKYLYKINFWPVDSAFLWPEVFISIIQQYIKLWAQNGKENHLHIIVDNIAYINHYPFLDREKMLVPAMVNVCNKIVGVTGYVNESRSIDIELTFVCSEDMENQSHHLKMIKQMSELYPPISQ